MQRDFQYRHRSVPGPSLGQQRGVGLIGFILLLAIIGFIGVIGMKIFPTFVEYRAIMSAVKKAQATGGTVLDIQRSFDKSATIDDITAIAPKDLDIAKVNDEIVVSFAYSKKIELFAPVSLVIDYKGSSKGL